jgi:hypothetical protein
MCRCCLCGPVTRHKADFAVSYGASDRVLNVCRYCQEDLSLLHVRVNQTVALPKVMLTARLPFWFLGPVRTLMESSS